MKCLGGPGLDSFDAVSIDEDFQNNNESNSEDKTVMYFC